MRKILLIEDKDDIGKHLQEILRLSNYEVTVAVGAGSGIELVRAVSPDVIVCEADLAEPGLFAFMRDLHRLPGTESLPVVVIGVLPDKGEIRKVMSAGADDCLPVPFEAIDLLRSVEACLNRKERLCHRMEKPMTEAFDPKAMMQAFGERDVQRYKKRQLLYGEGQRAIHVWLVVSGKVKTYRIHEDGKELITNIYGEDDLVGYAEAIEAGSYNDNARIMEDAELIAIPRQEFMEVLRSGSGISRWLLQMLARQSSQRDQGLVSLSYNSLRKRVANGLLELAQLYKPKEGQPVIAISRDNLAGIVGAAPESLTRTLSDFRKEQLISVEDGRILLLDELRLRNMIN